MFLILILTVPENTNVLDKLISMREALGWVTDIPRHGPDTRDKMEVLKDIPEDEKVSVNFHTP